jgi:hypothetical protein
METPPQSYFWPVVSACAAGGVLLVGLLMEVLAEKKRYQTIASFRRWASAKRWGEWLVIVGVLGEVVVAGVTAINERRNDPWNKPIATASAFADIVTSQNPRPASFFNLPPEDEGRGWGASLVFIAGTNLNSNVILRLSASPAEASAWNMGSTTNREWRIIFHENPLDFLSSESDRNKVLVKRFNEVNALILNMPFETNMVVESGFVVLTVNNLKWRFDIPRQRPRWGMISMTQSKDSTGSLKASILRVPIADFVSPPRFTNRWYDGQ